MKKIALFVLLATSVAVRWAFAAEEAEDGWISLFNGKNLDGWKASEEPDSFSAHDGILVVQAKGKAIVGQAPHAKKSPLYRPVRPGQFGGDRPATTADRSRTEVCRSAKL